MPDEPRSMFCVYNLVICNSFITQYSSQPSCGRVKIEYKIQTTVMVRLVVV